MSNGSPDKTSVFSLLMIRGARTIDPIILQREYIHDRVPRTTASGANWVDIDFESPNCESIVGHLVYEAVFCGAADGSYLILLDKILALFTPYYAPCDNVPVPEPPPAPLSPGLALQPLVLANLQRHAYVNRSVYYYLLPDDLDSIPNFTGADQLLQIEQLLAEAAQNANFDVASLRQRIQKVLSQNPLTPWVFTEGNYSNVYSTMRRRLFDALYVLYIARRIVDVSFERIMTALRTLHILEALAIDEFIAKLVGGSPTGFDRLLLSTLQILFPVLKLWDFSALPTGFPLIGTVQDLVIYLSATPVVQPLIARLFHYPQPWNTLKPLGIGDLKVVKQWLVGYVAGEISDIHNIMMGESKTRTHRRLEKTDQTFTFTSDQQQESTKDTQSTDRFELKRETDSIVKSDLNVNANTNLQYKNATITANISAGFAYGQATSDETKSAQNYSREVVSRAVSRIQSRTAETRTVTQIFETREFNKHVFDNVGGTAHISGIYRWLDKEYKAQVYNYGKRMMFELLVPEPAAFYVESRLRAYEASLDCPQPPAKPTLGVVTLPFTASDMDEAKFDTLRQQYDLSEFTYPSSKNVAFIDSATSQDSFKEDDLAGASDRKWYFKTFQCNVGAKGYQITDLSNFTGQLYFLRTKSPPYNDAPYFKFFIDGSQIFSGDYTDPNNLYPNIEFLGGEIQGSATNLPCLMIADTVNLTFGFQNIQHYAFAVVATVVIGPQALLDWQTQVYNKIRAIEQKKMDEANNALLVAYNTALTTYKNRLQEIRATVINDLLHGKSEALNANTIRTELKRQCLAFLAKEFDSNVADGLITDLESVGSRSFDFKFHQMVVHEQPDGSPPTTATIDVLTHRADYPLPDITVSQRKGRYIQFLEQAFEWQELAYIFYPYFWSQPPKWVDLMNRDDATDPTLAAFLQAGAARVLIAVSQAYDSAVLHFLATREPWNGGPAPALGDPLYLPLYEELKNQQDDLANAVPDGDPWTFRIPTSLVYIEGSSTPLPTYPSDAPTGS